MLEILGIYSCVEYESCICALTGRVLFKRFSIFLLSLSKRRAFCGQIIFHVEPTNMQGPGR